MIYKSKRIIDGKAKWIVIDEHGNIVNRNPNKEELKKLKTETYTKKSGILRSSASLSLGDLNELAKKKGFINWSEYYHNKYNIHPTKEENITKEEIIINKRSITAKRLHYDINDIDQKQKRIPIARGLQNMATSERDAFIWLQKKGYHPNSITYRTNTTPDFITDDGYGYEVKLLSSSVNNIVDNNRKRYLNIDKNQFDRLVKMQNTFILVFVHGNEEPIAVFSSNELADNLSLYKFINIDDRKKIDT